MPLDPPQFDLLLAMPKAELHLHLDGSIRIGTALDLARSRGVDAPSDAPAMAAALIAPERGADQAELLRAFELPIALLQDAEALARVAAELVEDKATDGVRYLEIRWGPNLHTREGLSLAEGIEAVCSGALDAGQRTGVEVRLICTAIRSHEPIENVRLAEAAGKFRDRGLTGWDLAGPEVAYPDPMLHADAFQAARDGGLRITVHAGEIGGSDPSTGRSAGAGLSAGSAQVRRALAVVPERIAHGPGAIDDLDLCRELIERGIALDLCPTSNVQAGVVPSLEAHPLACLLYTSPSPRD